MDLTLKCFSDSGCLAYLVGCKRTGQALLVDPKAGKGATYRTVAGNFGLEIIATFDTHTHADHLSGSAEFARDGIELWMGARNRCRRRHRSLAGGGPHPAERSVADLAAEHGSITAGRRWFDVCDPFEYRAGHIPGALSYPLSELGLHLDELRREEPVVLSCQGGVRSMTAARTLACLGVLDQPISMAGGFAGWQAAGLPVERTDPVGPA